MKILDRYKRLSLWNKVAFWGAVASMLGLLSGICLWIIPSPFQWQKENVTSKPFDESPYEEPRIGITSINVSAREPIWGHDTFDEDEIVIRVSGKASLQRLSTKHSIIAFWRLANDFETNWHVGRRRDGGNYKIATLDSAIANSGQWDFLIGGIECEKKYSGDILVVLLLYPQQIIEKNSYSWLKDSSGWGFRELPPGYIAVSPTRVFNTTSTRYLGQHFSAPDRCSAGAPHRQVRYALIKGKTPAT